MDNPEYVDRWFRDFGIPAEEVPRERRRLEIRKELANRKMIFSTVVSSLVATVASIAYREWMGNPAAFRELLYLAASATFLILILTQLISRHFTKIETERLEVEFPDGDNPFQRPGS